MKLYLLKKSPGLACLAALLFFTGLSSQAADFTVKTPDDNYYYAFNDFPDFNPTLTLTRGQTYTFDLQANGDHPFYIINGDSSAADGVANNNISSGTITYTVPINAPDSVYYVCSIHGFGGTIYLVDPPSGADFNVTTPDDNYFYAFNKFTSVNPTLTLTRGQNYTFSINASGDHPFYLINGDSSPVDGTDNNNLSSGTINYTVPTNAPNQVFYICSIHGFGGTINIVDPPVAGSPPPVKLLSITVAKNYVMVISTGTNGWRVVPVFSSNLTSHVWTDVPSFTNTFLNGTNTTTFGRLDEICGPRVFLQLRSTNN